MDWDAELYEQQHIFSVKYGQDMLSLINRNADQVILDLGCGTGALTKTLAQNGAQVIGLDASPTMIAKAHENYPELAFVVMDAAEMPYENKFDTVYSNAAMHWIKDHSTLLRRVHRALKPGGMLITEFGAKGNISAIERAFSSQLQECGVAFESQFYFPSAAEYRELLLKTGFTVNFIEDFDRPTPLAGGAEGLRKWIVQFYNGYLKDFTPLAKEKLLKAVENACTALWQNDQWVADYRRIRVVAGKPASPAV